MNGKYPTYEEMEPLYQDLVDRKLVMEIDGRVTLAAGEYNRKLEEKIRLVINDKPEWIPNAMWHWMIKTVIRIERTGLQQTEIPSNFSSNFLETSK